MPPMWVNEDGQPTQTRPCPSPGCGPEDDAMKTDFLRQAMETDWSAAIGPEYGRMVVTLVDRLRALEGWLPTPANVNALPEGLGRYIHDLETRCDPAGDVQSMALRDDTGVPRRPRLFNTRPPPAAVAPSGSPSP
jgi:hypothetical protein